MSNNRLVQRLGCWRVLGLFCWALPGILFLALAVLPVPLAAGEYADKAFHSLSTLWLMLWPTMMGWRRSYVIALAVALSVVGCGIEVLHQFMPERESSWVDLVANSGGILLGWGIGRMIATGAALPPLPALR